MTPPTPQPPKWAERFLAWYCRHDLLEEIQGDLYELYHWRKEKIGAKLAQRRFVWDVFRSFRLSTIKKFHPLITPDMFRNNVKIAWRHILRERYHSLINIFGLAIGIACCLLIGLYTKYELSYDEHHPAADRIFRVLSEDEGGPGAYHNPPLAGVLLQDFPEVEQAFRLRAMGSRLVKSEEGLKNSFEENFIYADPSILEILDLPLKYGDPKTALDQARSIVITSEKAEKYFPNENPIGKTFFLDDNREEPYIIGGVLAPDQLPSHILSDFYVSTEGFAESKLQSWTRSSYPTYIRLQEGVNPDEFADKMYSIALQYKKDQVDEGLQAGSAYGYRYQLQPISDIYLKSEDVTLYGRWAKGDVRYVWLFGAVALFILLIGVVNFINLSTAKTANRAKEVGVRKVVGADRRQLIFQFLTESTILTLSAALIALFLTHLALPYFQQWGLTGISIPWNNTWFLPTLLAASLLIGLLAGAYPSFYLSSFIAAKVLMGKLRLGSKGSSIRSVLVVFQFTVSIILIMATIMITRQMDFIQNKKLGFEKEKVLILEDTYMLGDKRAAFKEILEQYADISAVSLSSYLPVNGYRSNGSSFDHPDSSGNIREVELRRWFVDEDYLSTMSMDLIKGRNFSPELASDSNAIIINETAAKLLHFANPLGQQLKMNDTYTIVGVVKDFHFRSMKEPIVGLAFHPANPNRTSSTIIKTATSDYQSLLQKIEADWQTFAPDQAFRYHFLDERFNSMYEAEQRTGSIFGAFASLAIVIACLGLFALALFMVEQRNKEISIRKVLGASLTQILYLLSSDFLKMVFIALVLAIPLAWYFMQAWLRDFAYRISLDWDIFAIGGLAAVGIALITISYQSIQAALSNPVEALKGD